MIEKDDWRLLNDVEYLKGAAINPTDGEDVKLLLQQKKEQFKIKQVQAEIQQYKESFAQNIKHFNEKYRYADKEEIFKLNEFISKLNFVMPGQLHIKENHSFVHHNVYLCFLMGTSELLKIFIYGNYYDIIN